MSKQYLRPRIPHDLADLGSLRVPIAMDPAAGAGGFSGAMGTFLETAESVVQKPGTVRAEFRLGPVMFPAFKANHFLECSPFTVQMRHAGFPPSIISVKRILHGGKVERNWFFGTKKLDKFIFMLDNRLIKGFTYFE